MELTSRITELEELEELMEELKAEIEGIKDELKRHMDSMGLEELAVGTHIIRYTSVLTPRFDTTAFKKALPQVYTAYIKQTQSKRFSISK
ncbi:hypothetical protein B5G37_01665 [Pseudoflavonifractor sp. An85]|nr:hypothetical protein B5G37_01665 [Pseudoflavonifractor sp. An85]